MKKLSRKIYVGNIGENKITDTIDSLLEGRLNGDWTEYKKGDVAKYSFDFDDEYELELLEENNIKLNEVKEFINEGICYMVDECRY